MKCVMFHAMDCGEVVAASANNYAVSTGDDAFSVKICSKDAKKYYQLHIRHYLAKSFACGVIIIEINFLIFCYLSLLIWFNAIAFLRILKNIVMGQ